MSPGKLSDSSCCLGSSGNIRLRKEGSDAPRLSLSCREGAFLRGWAGDGRDPGQVSGLPWPSLLLWKSKGLI